MQTKPVVLFDIDYTLFDPRHFEKCFYPYLARLCSLDEELVRGSLSRILRETVVQDHFLDIDKFLKLSLSNLKKEEYIEEVNRFLFAGYFFKDGFYSEVKNTIISLSSIARLGIFSQGNEKLQGAKIYQSGFRNFIEKELTYLIKPKKIDFLPSLKKIHVSDKIFLVDDRLSILNEVKKQIPSVFGIWIKRGWYAENEEEIPNFSPDAEIENLSEVVKIVKSNL